jgi:hypothetical protein
MINQELGITESDLEVEKKENMKEAMIENIIIIEMIAEVEITIIRGRMKFKSIKEEILEMKRTES